MKRVAATDSQIKIAADGKSLDPAGIEFVLNPYDEIAVEAALKAKEQFGDSTVTVVTLGSGDSQKELRTCLAMGADKAVLINDGGRSQDAFSTAEIVAAYLSDKSPAMIFCGKQAVDGDESQFPPRLAELLNMPCVTEITSLTLEEGSLLAERDIEGAREVVKCSLPAVISTNKGLNEPRYANLKGIMAAKKKPLEEIEAAAIDPATSVESLSLPPARTEGKIVETVDQLVDALKNEAKVL
ncbi:MAG: electron transfer flavoprotein subunit beta/FixA family protein [Planctomycetota bacterium]